MQPPVIDPTLAYLGSLSFAQHLCAVLSIVAMAALVVTVMAILEIRRLRHVITKARLVDPLIDPLDYLPPHVKRFLKIVNGEAGQ
jgi:hypothetical protein